MRPSVSHYIPVFVAGPDKAIAIQRARGAPVLMEAFSYANLTVTKRRQLARNLYHLIDCKHPSLLTYLTLINDRSRSSYFLVSEAATLRPLSDELCMQTSMRIFSTIHSITTFLTDLLGAVQFVFDRHMRKEAIRLLCHSISLENVYLQADGHAKLALRPYYGRKSPNPTTPPDQRPLDIYENQSPETIVFLLGQIVLKLILTADDFTEFTKGRAYLLSLHCRARFGAHIVELVERMTRTIAKERVTLSTLFDEYCTPEMNQVADVSRGISRTSGLGMTDLMIAAGLDEYRSISLYLPFQQFYTDNLGRTALMIALENHAYAAAYYLLSESGYIHRLPNVDYGDLDYVPTRTELDEIAAAEAAEQEAAEQAERLAAEKKARGKKKKVSRPNTAMDDDAKPPSRTASRSGVRPGVSDKNQASGEQKTSERLREELEAKKAARPLPYTGVRGSFVTTRLMKEHKHTLFRAAIHYERHLLLQEGFTELMIAIMAANYKIFRQYIHQTKRQNIRGYTACMYSVEADCLPIVAKLIEEEKNIANSDGKTAGTLALELGNQQIIDLLTRYESLLDSDGNTLLHRSVLNNKPEDISRYLHLASTYNNNGKTALMLAAERGYDKCVEMLLSEAKLTTEVGPDVLAEWKSITALMLASCNGHANCVKLLEEEEAEMCDSSGQHTALMAAALTNRVEVISILLNREGGMQNHQGYTALMLAAQHENIEALNALVHVEAGKVDESNNTALMQAVLTGKTNVAKHLINAEAQVIRKDGNFALQLAIEQNNFDLARELMEQEGHILHSTGFTDLMTSAFFGDLRECSHLLNQVKCRTNMGMTALMIAARAGHLDVVQLLSKYEMGLFDHNAMTAGSYAYRNGHESIYSLLAEHEVVADEAKNTLLHKAAEAGDILLVKRYHHMVGRINSQNKTACQLAKHFKHDEVVNYLERKGDAVDTDQSTLLHLAAIKNSTEEVEKLLHMAGCYNKAGKTALMEAAERDHADVVELLLPCEAHIRATKGFIIGGIEFVRPTALMIACRFGSVAVCEKLVSTEAKLSTHGAHLTALMAAAIQDKVECIGVLQSLEQRMTNCLGRTALMLAAKTGKVAAVKALAASEHGLTDLEDKNAATIAKLAKKTDCVMALKPYEKPETKSRPPTHAECRDTSNTQPNKD
ncbi:Protein 21.1 [Giardia lamblia P15]|uniref:Protein 21.1 n=1 Tax=Giardia intestinalis (strain P15) TaxID=658858 RepID=E1F6H6_GIAIA|nr:Protein 21.1 [Giardia lamblia P15]